MNLKLTAVLLILVSMQARAQKTSNIFSGMYIQWGYNKEWYTRSNIHFRMANGNAFVLHKAKANDKPDLDAVLKKPLEVSIPQYNYRIGFYINKARTRAIELNFDHAKYVVTENQKLHVTGKIDGKNAEGDSLITSKHFLHLEHTDGANWLHVNYVQQHSLYKTKTGNRPFINLIWKAGAGINIPRTDFTWKGNRMNNHFHIAGYNLGVEGGARIYPFKRFFFEFTGKTGYVRYINALCNTEGSKGNSVKHGFGYFELIALVGYDIHF